MRYGAGFVLVSCEDTEENRTEVKRYTARHKLTQEQVKMVIRTDCENGTKDLALVIKTEVEIRGG
jgi:hypothetical protein